MKKANVGDELTALIPDWAVQFKGKCSCRDVARKMNRWGASGCEANRKYIVNHLMSQNEMLIPIFRALPVLLKKAAAHKLLTTAIKNAVKSTEQ
jgi:hypothetical protein